MGERSSKAAGRPYSEMPTDALLQTFLAEIPGRDWLHLSQELRELIWEMQKRFKEEEGPPQPVLDLLVHEDWAVRQNSAVILGELGGPEVVDALEKAALTDEDHRVRAWAADALYGIHRSAIKRQAYTEIPLASLVAALVAEMNSEWSDHLDWRRIIMREIVRRFREKEEVPDILISLLTDDVMFVRDISALMLGFIKRPQVINPLARAMFADDDAGVRAQAASSLERIGTPAALAALKAWLKEFEPTIEKRLTVKLLEQSAYGETDAEVMRRLALLADKKGVAQESIRHNYLRGRDRPEERAYLEAAIATYDEGRGPAAALPSWLNQMVAAARRVLQKRRQSAR